jgi:hypothetical protein
MKKPVFAMSAVLLFAACILIDSVEQPSEVVVGEQFMIRVTGTSDSTTEYHTGFLGLMLPIGIQVDSGRYTDSLGNDTLVTEPSQHLCSWLDNECPCDSNMYWSAFYVSFDLESCTPYEVLLYARVTDSAIAGRHLVDYRTGYYGQMSWTMSDSVLDLPMTVAGTAISQRMPRTSRTRGRVWPAVFRNRLNISVPGADEVSVFDAGGRLVRNLYVERSGYWDGTDESGRRVPAGAYLVRGEQVAGRVTLLD